MKQDGSAGSRRAANRRSPLRLVVALPFVTGLLSLGVGMYAYQTGRSEATAVLSAHDAARVWSTPPSLGWLLQLSGLGTLIGLAIALAFTHQLKTLARRTEFIARRNFSFPLEIEADGEVAPLVDAINDLLRSVREYARASVADGVVSFNREGRVVAINPSAAVALGVDAERVIGAPYEELIPEVEPNEPLREALRRALECSEAFDLHGVTWVTPAGQRLRLDVQGTVLAGEESIVSLLIASEAAREPAEGAVARLPEVQRQVSRAHRLMIIGGFAAELAHEIRNPLASVLGLVDLLHERLPEGDEGHRHLEVLARAAARIDRLVGQLVDLVPTERQELDFCDLDELVRDCVEFVLVGGEVRPRVQVEQRHEPGLPPVHVDAERVRRAIENLLHNALAHTPAGGQVRVETRRAGRWLEVEVANTGSYVPPEERERIFQPFVSGRRGGTGLGLAIAQQIARAHGGSLRVHSEPDSGTSFVLRLPIAREAVDGEEVRTAEPRMGVA